MVVPAGGRDFDMENPTRAKEGKSADAEGHADESSVSKKRRLALWAKLDMLTVSPKGPSPFGVLLTIILPLALVGYGVDMWQKHVDDVVQLTSLVPTRKDAFNITIKCVDPFHAAASSSSVGGFNTDAQASNVQDIQRKAEESASKVLKESQSSGTPLTCDQCASLGISGLKQAGSGGGAGSSRCVLQHMRAFVRASMCVLHACLHVRAP